LATLTDAIFFRTGATTGLCLVLAAVPFERAEFFTFDGTFRFAGFCFAGFFAFGAALLAGGRCVTFLPPEGERFEGCLEDLRRTAVTRLLIMAGFQRERRCRGLRATRRL
jgi:hypothetical protein